MDIESLRAYCLSLPQTTEDFPFDETTLAFRVAGKIFAMIDLEDTSWFVLKCQPDYAIRLRDRYAEISGAWHMNKRYWNQLNLHGSLPRTLVCHLICHSYNEVLAHLSRKQRQTLQLQALESGICPVGD